MQRPRIGAVPDPRAATSDRIRAAVDIRTRLRALTLATLIPVVAFGTIGTWVLVEREKTTLERAMGDRARSLLTAIESELRASATPLEVLARSPNLDGPDLEAFRAEAQRALDARRGDWANLQVSRADSGEIVLNLLVPAGTTPQRPQDPASIRAAARTGAYTVSPIVHGELKRPLFAMRVPVVRDGKVELVLSALVDPATVGRIVDLQKFPPEWAVAVLDGNFRFVVRHPASRFANEFAGPSLRQTIESASPRWTRGELVDGTDVYRTVRTSSATRWTTSMSVPTDIVETNLRFLWLLWGGFAIAGALGLWFAWWLASGLSRPIRALAAAAPALGSDQPLALPDVGAVDELRQLVQALEAAAAAIREREHRQQAAEQALRAADRAKDEFLAMLGHELRNPLASVANASHLLRLAPHQAGVVENVGAILSRQVQQMTRLVDDLLEVGRVTGGKIRLERAPFDLAALVAAVVDAWKGGDRFARHAVGTDLHEVWVDADRARLEQVVANLLDNALKYTPPGGRVDLSVRRDGDVAILEVTDTGEGMPPELIDRVFELFVQGERSLARERGGLGIGLTLARRLVEMNGGEIAAASEGSGMGATLTVRLPAIEPPAADAEAATPAEAASPALPRVLIVEDNADARESLAWLLRQKGHEVHTAETGEEGLALARTGAADVVLLDIGLPDIDGYEVARRLKADPATRHLCLLAVTGYGTDDDRRRALAAGFDEHVAKPVEPDALDALLQRHAARSAAEAAPADRPARGAAA
jgi:signal transduction histidine kinase/ActR/RegA family two-component response regulator